MKLSYKLLTCAFLASQAYAGLFISVGTSYNNLSHKLNLSGQTKDDSADVLGLLIGAGFQFQPSESFSLPLSVEMTYSNAKDAVAGTATQKQKVDIKGAILLRPTLHMGWMGAYGIAGVGQVNFTQSYKDGAINTENKQVASSLLWGAGLSLKLDRDMAAYGEYLLSQSSFENIYGYNTTSESSERGNLDLKQGRIMLGIRYFI
jgi:opacity protein-like surface antigen